MSLEKFIKNSPKAELHLHIEGTLEPELMFSLAKRNNVEIPFKNIDDVKKAYNFSNLDSFLKIYYEGAKVLIEEQDFFDLTWAYILKCKEDNIVHTEIFFDPQTHTDRGIDFDTVINGIFNALKKGEKEFGLSFKIIMCFLRHLSEKECFKILDKALAHKDKIFGVGLDSSETGNPPKKFEKLFQKAIENEFITVAHAGEEGPPEYIWEALNLLNVHRIDHGVQCLKDEKLVKILSKSQIP
jgi:adenosine deaminase